MPRWMAWIQAEQEYGMTMPVVPRIESPPLMPSLGFQVCLASSSPFTTPISRTTSVVPPWSQASLRIASVMISLGFGLMAGSPGATGRPGLGHGSHALAGAENDPAARFAPGHGDDDFGAVGDIGIVPCILDY